MSDSSDYTAVRPAVRRRALLVGVGAIGIAAVATRATEALADGKPKSKPGMRDASAAGPLTAAHKAVIAETADCIAAGRICMARCTDHLATGMTTMAACQRAVMNMLAVTQAMADVAGYANTDSQLLQQLGKTCAAFCRNCAKACEPHADHHQECKACRDACLRCAKACDSLA